MNFIFGFIFLATVCYSYSWILVKFNIHPVITTIAFLGILNTIKLKSSLKAHLSSDSFSLDYIMAEFSESAICSILQLYLATVFGIIGLPIGYFIGRLFGHNPFKKNYSLPGIPGIVITTFFSWILLYFFSINYPIIQFNFGDEIVNLSKKNSFIYIFMIMSIYAVFANFFTNSE